MADREWLVWALTGPRQGDNNQVLDLAEAIGLPFVEKRLVTTWRRHLPGAIASRDFRTLDAATRATMAAPWPDLVIAIGRRSVPVARAIRAAAGKPVRLVQIGEPRSPPGWFDLVLTTPQYDVPRAANVILLPHALTRGVHSRVSAPGGAPLAVMLVGGPSWPWRLDQVALLAAARHARAAAGPEGGRVIALTGSRTPPAIRTALAGMLGADAIDAIDYRAALAAGTRFYVTGDSASMLSDAIVTGCPVGLIPVRATAAGRLWVPLWRATRGGRTLYPRDLPRFWQTIRDAGLVGAPENPASGTTADVRAIARDAVLALLAEAPASV